MVQTSALCPIADIGAELVIKLAIPHRAGSEPLRIRYCTDMERVRKLIKRTGQEMAEIPEFADKMLEPLKSQGVIRTEGAGLIFRAKFMTRPGDQFLIRREAFRRIQEALMAEGIEFAPDAVTVRVMDEASNRPDATMAAAAAAKSVQKRGDA